MMKQISIYAFLTLFIMSCTNETEGESTEEVEPEAVTYCDCNELAFDQAYNTFYLESPRDGFTGLCEVFYANGNLSFSKNFNKGKVHGEMTTYYENGQVKERKSFDMNLQTGDHFLYEETGELIFHLIYEEGQQVETVYAAG